MTHNEVFEFFKVLAPSVADRVIEWWPCGKDTIRFKLRMISNEWLRHNPHKEPQEFCFSVGIGGRDWYIRPYAEWFKEEFDDEEGPRENGNNGTGSQEGIE